MLFVAFPKPSYRVYWGILGLYGGFLKWGYPQSSILMGFFLINHLFSGSPIYGKPHISNEFTQHCCLPHRRSHLWEFSAAPHELRQVPQLEMWMDKYIYTYIVTHIVYCIYIIYIYIYILSYIMYI